MIQMDISNVWGEISLPELLELEKDVVEAHNALTQEPEDGSAPWSVVPFDLSGEVMERIVTRARKIRAESDVCVVAGSGITAGAEAVIHLLQGPSRNLTASRANVPIEFVDASFSPWQRANLNRMLDGRNFSVIVMSASGADPETALCLRQLRWMLERRYGTEEARSRITAVTAFNGNPLHTQAEREGWELFEIQAALWPANSVLTPAGLLPMAVAGVDIRQLLIGARRAAEDYDLRSYENPAWLYAAIRILMSRRGKTLEIVGGFEPGFRSFGAWWQQLFSGSRSGEPALYPTCAQYPEDVYRLSGLMGSAHGSLFETLVRFEAEPSGDQIIPEVLDPDGLNCLAGAELSTLHGRAYESILDLHCAADLSIICMECGECNADTVGQLLGLLILASEIAGKMNEHTEKTDEIGQYKKNFFAFFGNADGKN